MRAIVADDHPLYREAVCVRLSRAFAPIDIVEVAGFNELLAAAGPPEGVDLVLIDLYMPDLDRDTGIGQVVEAFPGAAVVLMSGLASPTEVHQAVHAGVRGFLPKTMPPDLFSSALTLILGGGTYLPTEVLQAPAAGLLPADSTPLTLSSHLTPREQQVLVALASGASNKEIARELGLSEVTIKLHVRQILRKIGARNRSEAVSISIRGGLL